jgi:hypothetical protein
MRRDEVFRNALAEEWRRGVEHAGFSESDGHLWLCTGYSEDVQSWGACYYKPYMEIEDERFLSRAQKEEAESEPFWARHRVAIFHDFRCRENDLGETLVPVMGAMLRHELEHARQQVACGNDLLDIDDQFVDRAVGIKVGGLHGGTDLYNQKPIEQDANAAAAMYLREHHADHVDAILHGPCAQLTRSNTPPESTDTLLARTIAFLFQFRDICERDTGDIEFPKRLGTYDQRAAHLWRQLESGGKVPAAGRRDLDA